MPVQHSPQTPARGKKHKRGSHSTPPSAEKESKRPKEEEMIAKMIVMEDEIKALQEQNTDLRAMIQSGDNSPDKKEDLKASIDFLAALMEELRKEMTNASALIKSLKHVEEEVRCLRNQNRNLSERIIKLEDYSRIDNIVITGIDEKRNEDCRQICVDMFREVFGIKGVEIVRAHRLGPQSMRNRKMIVRFKMFAEKEVIMKNRRELRNRRPGVFIDDDFSPETLRIRQNLRPVVNLLRSIDERTHLRGDKIFYKGRLFSQSQLHDLPIDTHQACTKTQAGVTVFSGMH